MSRGDWRALALLSVVALFAAGCSCGGPSGTDAGLDAAPGLDAAADSGIDGGGPRCPSCIGAVRQAIRGAGGVPGFTVECPEGQVVDFAGTQRWVGSGSDLVLHACSEENPAGGEASFYVCCEAGVEDAGVVDGSTDEDAGSKDAGVDAALDAGALGAGDVCDPGASLCGAGLACCYPCGIPDCEYQCETRCADGEPGCVGGCLLRP